MTTTDEARVTDERRKFMEGIVNIARNEREFLHCCSFDDLAEALIDYADRLAAREAERAEMVALLEATHEYQSTDYCDGADGDEPLSDECYDEKPCWSHRAAALLAKLRGGTP